MKFLAPWNGIDQRSLSLQAFASAPIYNTPTGIAAIV